MQTLKKMRNKSEVCDSKLSNSISFIPLFIFVAGMKKFFLLLDFTWIAFITTKITNDLEEVKPRLQRLKGESESTVVILD